MIIITRHLAKIKTNKVAIWQLVWEYANKSMIMKNLKVKRFQSKALSKEKKEGKGALEKFDNLSLKYHLNSHNRFQLSKSEKIGQAGN